MFKKKVPYDCPKSDVIHYRGTHNKVSYRAVTVFTLDGEKYETTTTELGLGSQMIFHPLSRDYLLIEKSTHYKGRKTFIPHHQVKKIEIGESYDVFEEAK